MAVLTPAQTIIVTDTDPALQRDYGNTIQGTLSPLTTNAVIYVTTNEIINNYTNVLGGASAGNAGEIQFAENGGFSADSGLTYNPTVDTLSVSGGVITGSLTTDLLYHANGDPWSFTTTNTAAGGNTTELQYNNAGNTAGIPSVRYFTGNGVLSLGTVANVKINGGSSSQYLQTDGAGNLTFATVVPSAAGNDTQIQFNNASVTTGAANFTYNYTTQIVSANGLTVTNLATANNITVTSNIGAGNISVTGRANVTGNIISGNLTTTNLVAATVNATGNISTNSSINSVNANITGNANIGNINTTAITASGNIAFSGSNVSLGSVNNLKITGGVANRILQTDGAGNLSWAVPTTAPAGSNTQIQFNDAGLLAGNANLTYNKSTNTLSAYNVNFTGPNVTLGNAVDVHMFGGATTPAVVGQPVVTSGVIQSIPVTTNGLGYDYPPLVTLTGAFTTAANVVAVLDSNTGAVLSIQVISGGTGYSSATTASIAAPGVKYLATNGAGNLAFREAQSSGQSSGGSTSPSGPSTSVQFNDAGALAGSSAFTFNKNTSSLSVSNNISIGNAVNTVLLNATGNVAFSGANVSLGSVSNLRITGGTNAQVLTTNGSGVLGWTSAIGNGNSFLSIAANSNVTINAAASSWVFKTDSTLTFPDGTIVGNIEGSNTFGFSSNNSNIQFLLEANTTIWEFDGITGNLNLPANGSINFNGGNIQAQSEIFTITGGESVDSTGGIVNIYGGQGDTGGGDVSISGGQTSNGTGGAVSIYGGSSGDGDTSWGNIVLGTGGQSEWVFDNTGNLTLADGGAVSFVGNNGSVLRKVSIKTSTNANFDANYTLTLPVNDGTSGQLLSTDGSGVLSWITLSANSITNGNSNVTVAANANINISSNGTANVIQIVSSGDGNLQTTGMIANGFIRANAVTSNNFIFGNSTVTLSTTRWLGASTTSTAPNQILYTVNSANITSIDFNITASGVTGSGNSRQVAKILAVTIDSVTNFTEYGGQFVGANLGDFNVTQSGSNVRLVVTPTTANTIQYNIILTTYF
jgi:hypothetical protein